MPICTPDSRLFAAVRPNFTLLLPWTWSKRGGLSLGPIDSWHHSPPPGPADSLDWILAMQVGPLTPNLPLVPHPTPDGIPVTHTNPGLYFLVRASE